MERYVTFFMNKLISRVCGRKRRPTYFDIDATYPDLNEITRSFPAIRKEFEGVLARGGQLPAYHELDPQYGNAAADLPGGAESSEQKVGAPNATATATITPAPHWNVFMLYLLGYKPERNRALCPETCRALDRIPNLMQAFFSILDPRRSIALHQGPYLGFIRYHLALRVPKVNPPMIIVNSQPHVWKEGEAVLFDDTWPHEVINQCDELRAVLIVDVLRPMPALPALLNKAVLFGLAAPTYGRAVMKRVERAERAIPFGGA